MTLQQWASAWPESLTLDDGQASVKDRINWDNAYRALAWALLDFEVVSLEDGRIWWERRKSYFKEKV